MQAVANRSDTTAVIRVDLAAIFVSLELSRSKWLITSLAPGAGERMSRFVVPSSEFGRPVAVRSDQRNKVDRWLGKGRLHVRPAGGTEIASARNSHDCRPFEPDARTGGGHFAPQTPRELIRIHGVECASRLMSRHRQRPWAPIDANVQRSICICFPSSSR